MVDLENEQTNYENQTSTKEVSKQEINNYVDPTTDVVSSGLELATTGLIGFGVFKLIRKKKSK